MDRGAAEAAPQSETQRGLFGRPAPPAAPAAGSGTSGVQPSGKFQIQASDLAKQSANYNPESP